MIALRLFIVYCFSEERLVRVDDPAGPIIIINNLLCFQPFVTVNHCGVNFLNLVGSLCQFLFAECCLFLRQLLKLKAPFCYLHVSPLTPHCQDTMYDAVTQCFVPPQSPLGHSRSKGTFGQVSPTQSTWMLLLDHHQRCKCTE